MTEEKLHNTFSEFGEILNIELKEKMEKITALVTFKTLEDSYRF